MSDLTVVKVGGSLFDLPELGPRLLRWLARLSPARVLLVPGGGPTADVVRNFDGRHGLGEEQSHWLALRALTLNAHFLASLLPGSRVVESPNDWSGAPTPGVKGSARGSGATGCTQPVSNARVEYNPWHPNEQPSGCGGELAVLDPFAFCVADERDEPAAALPHTWAVTSDSIAARVAVAAGARRLVLLKSVTIPDGMGWGEAAVSGYVDAGFPGVIGGMSTLEVRAVNFRPLAP